VSIAHNPAAKKPKSAKKVGWVNGTRILHSKNCLNLGLIFTNIFIDFVV